MSNVKSKFTFSFRNSQNLNTTNVYMSFRKVFLHITKESPTLHADTVNPYTPGAITLHKGNIFSVYIP